MSASDTTVFIVREESDLNHAYDFAEALLQVAGDLEIEIGPYVPKRSTLQNRLYWEYMTQLGKHTGHTKDEMSLFFKWKFLGTDQAQIYGQSFNAVRSTTDLTVKEFAEYLRSIEVFASEHEFTFTAPPYYEDAWR